MILLCVRKERHKTIRHVSTHMCYKLTKQKTAQAFLYISFSKYTSLLLGPYASSGKKREELISQLKLKHGDAWSTRLSVFFTLFNKHLFCFLHYSLLFT